MNNLGWHSLRSKIIIYLSVIIIIFLGVFNGYRYIQLKYQLELELNSRADTVMQRLADELKYRLWELDEDLIQDTLNSESKLNEVHSIFVEDVTGLKISIDKDSSGDNHKSSDYVFRSKQIIYNGVELGNVKLYLTYEFMNKRLNQELRSAIILAIFQIILMVLFLWVVINKIILYPIETLVRSTKLIADGEYSNFKLNLGNDEIGLLGKSIQKMNKKISLRENDIRISARQLKEVKEQLELAVNGTKDGLWDWNIETNKIYFSPPWKSMLGYEDDEFTNKFESWEKIIHPDDIDKTKKDIIFSHNSKDGIYENIHRLRHKDGNWVWILARGKTIFNEHGKPVRMLGFHTDITKQKNLELELHKQEELIIAQSRHVAMGEMISMIAHQWRQPITVITMGANNMLVDIALEEIDIENFKHNANDILKQAEYLSKTIDDFKNFFRPNKDKDIVNVCDVILEAKELMGKSITNSNIELIFTDLIDENITTYSRELLQVILNLLKNSKEVLEEKSIKNAYIKISVKKLNGSIIISVCDNGGGIKEDIKNRIFDPYFSTKGPKIGTGLGLYMSKTIVEKHLLGEINIIDIDDGVCFNILLPKDLKADKQHASI